MNALGPVIDIIKQGLAVLRTRDGVQISDEQIAERANNIVQALVGLDVGPEPIWEIAATSDLVVEPPDWNWNEASRAVVASDGHDGQVLWSKGAHIETEICESGTGSRLQDLGLDDAPCGISVWEGFYKTVQCGNPLDGYDYETEPKGRFRAPTDEEWSAIRAGRNPWR
jgi:hypothetical protein